jgi:hypothetical protein
MQHIVKGKGKEREWPAINLEPNRNIFVKVEGMIPFTIGDLVMIVELKGYTKAV